VGGSCPLCDLVDAAVKRTIIVELWGMMDVKKIAFHVLQINEEVA